MARLPNAVLPRTVKWRPSEQTWLPCGHRACLDDDVLPPKVSRVAGDQYEATRHYVPDLAVPQSFLVLSGDPVHLEVQLPLSSGDGQQITRSRTGADVIEWGGAPFQAVPNKIGSVRRTHTRHAVWTKPIGVGGVGRNDRVHLELLRGRSQRHYALVKSYRIVGDVQRRSTGLQGSNLVRALVLRS